MPVSFESYIGVEVSPDKDYPFTFALLDDELTIRSIGRGGLSDAFSFLAGQDSALAAVNAPSATNKGIIKREEIRRQLSPKSHLARWANLRLVEYELAERGIPVIKTPDSKKNIPKWMELGFQLFKEIENIKYEPYPSLIAPKQYFESHGEACFWSLLGHAPLEEGTLEGCLQRQVALRLCGISIPDAMQFFQEITRHRLLSSQLPVEDIFTNPELNAIASGYTAWLASNEPKKIIKTGHAEEGFVYLPNTHIQDDRFSKP